MGSVEYVEPQRKRARFALRAAGVLVVAGALIAGALAFALAREPDDGGGRSARAPARARPPAPAAAPGRTFVDGRPHRVTWDRDSLLVDGRRIFVTAGEFDYWRL